MKGQKRGIYIHIPFCAQKCNYCAFLSFPDAPASLRKEYMQALCSEIKLRAESTDPSTAKSPSGSPCEFREITQNDPDEPSESRAATQNLSGDSAASHESAQNLPGDSAGLPVNRPERGIKAASIDTVYIGGGTPSVVDASQLSEMMTLLRRSFDIKPDAEITIEINPSTLGCSDAAIHAKLRAYRSMGINRISMGVQSMNDERLRYLGRIHTAEAVIRDMDIIREEGFENVSLDLIFSIPYGSREAELSDLARILELRPGHISCYSLQIEEGTAFGRMAETGELTEVPDEEDRDTYHRICKALREAGYEHYEISNFARMPAGADERGFVHSDDAESAPQTSRQNEPGSAESSGPGHVRADSTSSPYRSRHNSLYWNMDEYIGLGLGASGFVNGARYKNTSDIREYISAIGRGILPVSEEYVNTAFDNISEAVFTGLRRREGITYEDAAAAYMVGRGKPEDASAQDGSWRDLFWDIFADAKKEAEDYAARGLLIIDDKGLRLTERGIDISNSIMALFV